MIKFSPFTPSIGLKKWIYPIIDSHLHFWDSKHLNLFFTWAEHYFNKDYSVVSMMRPEFIPKLPEEYRDRVYIAQFLSTKHLAEYNANELVKQVDKAYEDGVQVFKLWLAPRFLDANNESGPFNLLEEKLKIVFERLEYYHYIVSAHIADPDIWFLTLYQNCTKYGLKNDLINRFLIIHEKYKGIKFFATHFGCLPENLTELSRILDQHPRLMINTGSTRWMIRELSKNPVQSKTFIEKYQDRIIFGTDLHVIEEPMNPEYFMTRFWSHRLFWETDLQSILPFPDPDAPFGTTFTGLALNEKILKKIYYQNFLSFIR